MLYKDVERKDEYGNDQSGKMYRMRALREGLP